MFCKLLNPLFWELDKKFWLLKPRELAVSVQRANKMSRMMFSDTQRLRKAFKVRIDDCLHILEFNAFKIKNYVNWFEVLSQSNQTYLLCYHGLYISLILMIEPTISYLPNQHEST